jgi:hypothetical protein
MRFKFLGRAGVALGICIWPVGAHAGGFTCDWTPVAGSSGAGNVKALLANGDTLDNPTALSAVVGALHKLGLSKLLIADNVISAYCTDVLANSDLNDREKTTRMRRFATLVTQTVYGSDGADAVILDVTLPPDIVDAVQSKAKASGITAEEWIARTVTDTVRASP